MSSVWNKIFICTSYVTVSQESITIVKISGTICMACVKGIVTWTVTFAVITVKVLVALTACHGIGNKDGDQYHHNNLKLKHSFKFIVTANKFWYEKFGDTKHGKGPSWSWSYGSWSYNYLWNQCISPLKLWVRIPLMARCTRSNMWPTTIRSRPRRPLAMFGISKLFISKFICCNNKFKGVF
jgi:hypothetical protein